MAINFIPQEEIKEKKTPDFKLGLILGLVTVALVGTIFGAKFILLTSQKSNLDAKEKEISNEEAGLSDFKKAIEEYQSNPSLLLAIQNHTYYTKLFDSFSKSMPTNLKISDISISSDQAVSITGQALGKYSDVSNFMKLLRSNGFSDLKLGSVSKTDERVNFTLQFKFPKQMIGV